MITATAPVAVCAEESRGPRGDGRVSVVGLEPTQAALIDRPQPASPTPMRQQLCCQPANTSVLVSRLFPLRLRLWLCPRYRQDRQAVVPQKMHPCEFTERDDEILFAGALKLTAGTSLHSAVHSAGHTR